MTESFLDALATVLEAGCWVTLTTVDRQGEVHTCPARALRGPFRGQIWLRLGREPIDALYEGAEATVSFSGAAEGPYVTVKGWAVRLPADDALEHREQPPWTARHSPRPRRPSPLVCVTATAAQLWESLSSGDPRVFAFPAPDPHRSTGEFPVQPSRLPASDPSLRAAVEHST